MSDPRYSAGIKQGIAIRDRREWPAEVPGLGPMQGGQPIARCVICPDDAHPYRVMTNVRYGGKPLCKDHALERSAAE